MPRVANVLIAGAKSQARIVKDFATRPVGAFKTVDRMIESARGTAKGAARSVGIPSMASYGQRFFRGKPLGSGRIFRGQNLLGSRSLNTLPAVRKIRSRVGRMTRGMR